MEVQLSATGIYSNAFGTARVSVRLSVCPARSAVGVQCVVVRTVDPLYNNTVCLQCGLCIPFLPTADGSAHCTYTVATMSWNHCGLQWALYLHCSDFVILSYTQWSYSAQRQWAYSGLTVGMTTVGIQCMTTVVLQWAYSGSTVLINIFEYFDFIN